MGACRTIGCTPSTPSELYTTDHHNVADGLTGLPRDYAGVPRQAPPLGPPLPGDLGRPILNAQNAPSANDSCRRFRAATHGSGDRGCALEPAVRLDQYSRTGAARPRNRPRPTLRRRFGTGQHNRRPTMHSRRTARIENSPSSMPPSIAAPRARIGSLRPPRPMCCRQATSSRRL